MKLYHFCHPGKRLHQDDSYYLDNKSKRAFIVCDGVGGSTGGDLASRSTIEYLKRVLTSVNSNNCTNEKTINLYNNATKNLFEVLRNYPENSGMATTVVMVEFTSRDVIISHIGDSRAYVLKPSTHSYWRTKDHSLVQELYDAGIIKSEQDMQSHPMKNRITGAISTVPSANKSVPDIARFDSLDAGDMIILCSDGVLETFQNEEFINILIDETLSFEERGKKIQSECAINSFDNNTCIILQLEEGEDYSSGSNTGIVFRKIK